MLMKLLMISNKNQLQESLQVIIIFYKNRGIQQLPKYLIKLTKIY